MSRYYYEIEDCRVLDSKILKQEIKKGYGFGEYSWLENNNVVSKIGYSVKRDYLDIRHLTVSYTITDYFSKEKQPYDYDILISETKSNLKGSIYWLSCPIYKNGLVCGKRTRKLYLAPNCNYFGCRECLNLSYHTKQRDYKNGLFKRFRIYYKIHDLSKTISRTSYNGKPTRKMKKLLNMMNKFGYLYR